MAKSGKTPEGLEPPVIFPKELMYIWDMFTDLSLTVISYTEIMSYCSLRQINIKPWEVDAIMSLNAVKLKVMS